MRKFTSFLLAVALLFVCACTAPPAGSTESSAESIGSSEPEAATLSEASRPEPDGENPPAEESIQSFRQADGLYDLSGRLGFDAGRDEPAPQCRFVGDTLVVWSNDRTVVYDYQGDKILREFDQRIQPLGLEHYSSITAENPTQYRVTLYDRNFEVVAEHESDRPAFPAIDGKTLVYDSRQVECLNTESGEVKTFSLSNYSYDGGIWIYDFDGACFFFTTTCNPKIGPDGIGYYNALTGESHFEEIVPAEAHVYPGIPVCFGENKALYWQAGEAYGTDGTYCLVLDASTAQTKQIDVGATNCRISDNGTYLLAVDTGNEEDSPSMNCLIRNISLYDAQTLALLDSIDLELPLTTDLGYSLYTLSLSDDGAYTAFSGQWVTGESGRGENRLFLYAIQEK